MTSMVAVGTETSPLVTTKSSTPPGVVLDVRVLGPTVVTDGRRALDVDRTLERALLVRLALAAGTVVPDDRLMVDLWDADDGQRAAGRLRVLVSRLRVALGERRELLVRASGGYRISATSTELQVVQVACDRLHAAMRRGDQLGVRDAARAALAQWRGPALADLRTIPFADAEARRLDEWHLDLTVHRLAAELASGAAPGVVVELTGLADQHPLHEQVQCLLARALYCSGRQGDALDRLAQLRRILADELGIDPAPETVGLQLRILRHDPTLFSGIARPAASTASAPVHASRSQDPSGPSNGFFGRDAELTALHARLSLPGLTTLVGVVGSGKSRLAIEAVRDLAAEGRRVVLVELTSIRSGEDAIAGIAAAIGTDPAALDDAILVLDNAEHLVDQVSETVSALRRAAPDLHMLVTSQRPLLLAGEAQHRVGPLSRNASIALFTDRATPAAMVGVDEADLVRIQAAVDGLPLGIELAAGLTRTLTVRQIADRMGDRLRLLVGGARNAGWRHTSLRAALAWSHELLGERERAVLRRIAVFTSDFDLEAAEVIAPDGRVATGDVAPALAELVDRSLVTVTDGAGQRRFTVLDTIREYALAQLDAAGELTRVNGRYQTWLRGSPGVVMSRSVISPASWQRPPGAA
jgi:predicted ATPase/DNA-binding SARP family transcriptional activator